MPELEVMKATDAPQPPKKVSKVASQLLEALETLKKDEVIKLTPDEGRTVRGLKTSIGRISSNHEVKLTSWDDGQSVYIRKQ